MSEIRCDKCNKEIFNYDEIYHFTSVNEYGEINPHVHICESCVNEYNYQNFFIQLDEEYDLV